MQISFTDSELEIGLAIITAITTIVSVKFGTAYYKFKQLITKAKELLIVVEDIMKDDKATPDEIQNKLVPAINELINVFEHS